MKVEKYVETAIQNIPLWIRKGKELIDASQYSEWEECVNACANGIFHGMDIEAALKIMEALNNDAPIEEVAAMHKKEMHSGTSNAIVKKIVFDFSKRGFEFVEAVSSKEAIDEIKECLKVKEQRHIQKLVK